MEKVIILWIALQLMILGYWDFQDRNAIYRGEFNCEQITMSKENEEWHGSLLPILTIPTKATLMQIELCLRNNKHDR